MKPYALQTPTGTYDVTPVTKDRVPIELRDLSRESFTHLGEWQHELYNDGTGWAFRLGMKEGVKDSVGDPATLMVLFIAGLSRKEQTSREPLEVKVREAGRLVAERLAVVAAQTYSNVITITQHPPEYMLRELEGVLKRDGVM